MSGEGADVIDGDVNGADVIGAHVNGAGVNGTGVNGTEVNGTDVNVNGVGNARAGGVDKPITTGAAADVLEALRAATAQRHTVLDSNLPLGGPAPTLSDYRDHLLMLRAWLAPMERWLAGFADGPHGVPRTARIDADLLLIDAAMVMPEDATPWPDSASAAYRWGVSYVVEGSQLGGAVLYKRLAQVLAPHPLGYLKSDAGPGPRWREFVAELKAHVQLPQDVADACKGACDAFDRLLASRHAPI